MNHLKSRLTLGLILVSIIYFFILSTAYATAKIESSLLQEAEEQEQLNVIIFVKSPDLNAASAEVKKRFDPEIKSLSEEVRKIHRKYLPRKSLNPEEEKEFVRKAPPISPSDQERLKLIHERLDETMDEKKRAIGMALRMAASPNLDDVADFVTASGGLVRARVYVISALGATIPSYVLTELAGHPLVLSIERDRKRHPLLDISVPSSGFATWWSNGFSGGLYDVGIIEWGVQEDHPAFSGISFISNSGIHTDPTGHGTHVAGIVASGDTFFRGGAYGLDTIIWSEGGTIANEVETMGDMEWQATVPAENPEVINQSAGYGVYDDLDYENNDAFYDAFIRRYNILIIQAAGNNGWTDLALDRPAGAYNLITVANMYDKTKMDRSEHVRSDFSSIGPTLGGRKKPDLTAPGTDILSCNWHWATETDFMSLSGTSMAAPHVTAAIVLLEDGGLNHNPMAQKAVLINTADAWTSQDTSDRNDDGPTPGSHWDKSYGWGYLNMDTAYFHRNDYFNDSVVPNNGTAVDDDYKLYKGPMLADEKATLVWHKRVDYIGGTGPGYQNRLSDLDIILFNEADSSLKGWDTGNTIDNVHQVCTPSDITGVIKVYAVDASFEYADHEDFALATQELFVKADPPSFDVGLSMPASVETSTNFTVTVDVTNNGDVKAHNNNVTLSLPGGFSIQSGANPQNIGSIAASGTGQATWTVRSSATPGGYNLSASNASTCYYETYTCASGDTPITVTAVPGPHALSNDMPEIFSDIPKDFTFSIINYDWCGVAINPSTDHDIIIDNDSDLGSPYAISEFTDKRDFVVANGHIKGTVTHYAQVYWGSSSSYTIEAEWNALDITAGKVYSDSMPAGDVIQMYESYLLSGNQYRVEVDITSGSGDLALYIFKASREHGGRLSGDYDYSSESGGSGDDESVSFTADCTGEFGIAVINDNASSASYTISVIELDTTCPHPNPMTWTEEPAETSTSSISMTATTATDDSPPIEYKFDFTSSPTGGSGGSDSILQTSTSYTDTGLGVNHQYGYRVMAQDSLGNPTGYSSISYDYTDIETPTGITFGTVTTTSIQAKSANTPSGLSRGNSGLIIYNVTKVTNSAWKQNNDYWTSGSLSPNTQYGFRARAKNGDANETGYCSTAYKYTLANTPGAAGFTNVTQTSIRANWTANGNPAGTQYYCENITNTTNSGWTANTYWDSTGLACGTPYSFRVYAKNGNDIPAGPTSLGSQSTSECPDEDPPTPNPMTWATEPYETSTSSIAMTATTATDASPPIQYHFDFTSSPTGGTGGSDSIWQASTSYTDTGLGVNHQYGYRVQAKDSLGNPTGYSSISYDYTDIETPSGITFGTVTTTSIQARSTNTPSGLTRGNSGLIVYNVTKGTNSDWKQNNNLWTSGSLSPNTQYGFRAQAKNGDGDPTGECATAYKYTLANAPGAAGFTNVTQTSIRANWTANGNPAGTQYWCENTTNTTNSGWTANTYWDSTGLECDTPYSFRVYSKNGNDVPAGPTSLGSQTTAACSGETDPPTPNPMTWATEPYETSTSSIAMTATTATDASPPIQYHFDFTSSLTGGTGGTDSAWQASTSYTDTGLQANHQYGYRVQAKDSAGNPPTDYSSESYDYTDIETPTGITFGTVTTTSIQARSTNTPSGLTRGNSGLKIFNVTDVSNSDWKQNNNLWTSGSLWPNIQYGFRAQAKNGDGDPTPYCPTAYKYTLANTPGIADFTNVTQTSIRANWTANNNTPGTEYWCENTTKGTNSGWITGTSWDSTGLACGTPYSFQVYSKNGDGIPAGPTSLGSQATSACEVQTGDKYCTDFDERGDWTGDSNIYVDEDDSRLYWYTNSSYHSAYDNISAVTQAGDVIEFEYHYLYHFDSSTRQDVVFGFTDSISTYENTFPDNLIGGYAQNYYNPTTKTHYAQTHVKINKDGSSLFNWGENDHPRGTPAVYKARIEIVNSSTYSVTIWKDNVIVYPKTNRSGDLTGIHFTLCAAWNKQTQYGLSMQGLYEGYLDYICWTVSGSKGLPPGVMQLLLMGE